jgi:hypothetical protein
MQKNIILVSTLVFLTAACSSTPKTNINCEKMELDSQTKLVELQTIFNAYQDINYDLAVRLSTPFKDEVQRLDSRIQKQKQRCWSGEEKELDKDIASLKEDMSKLYGHDMASKPMKRKRSLASVARAQPVETPTESDVDAAKTEAEDVVE